MRKKIYTTATILCIIDLIIKQLITNYLPVKEIIPNIFSIFLTHNTGAAFSILNNNQIILILIAVIILIIIDKKIIPKATTKLETLSISMIIGGALGNLIDRIINNYVIDYLSFNIFGYHFPVFNFADILITIGAILLAIQLLKGDENENNTRKK